MLNFRKTAALNIGSEVAFRSQYGDYYAILLTMNLATRRAQICMWDHVLSGGCWRVLSVDMDRLSRYIHNEKAAAFAATA